MLPFLFLSLAIQMVFAIHAIVSHSEKLFDLVGSSTFIVLVLKSSFFPFDAVDTGCTFVERFSPTFFVTIWGIRLGLFLFARVLAVGEDCRFKRAKDNWKVMFTFWVLQGVWCFIVSSPVILVNVTRKELTASASSSSSMRCLQDNEFAFFISSLFLAALGLLFEVVADQQKAKHRSMSSEAAKAKATSAESKPTLISTSEEKEGNAGTHRAPFIRTGLWSISRHPNYFGEITFWTGLAMACATILYCQGLVAAATFCAISPAFTAFLLIKVSGIPILEKISKKRWGDDPEFKAYVERVPVLVPSLRLAWNAIKDFLTE